MLHVDAPKAREDFSLGWLRLGSEDLELPTIFIGKLANELAIDLSEAVERVDRSAPVDHGCGGRRTSRKSSAWRRIDKLG